MPNKNKKPHTKNEGGSFGPSAKETKQTRGNMPRGQGATQQRREWWMQEKARKKKARKPKEWTNKGVNDPWWPRARI